MEKLCNREAHIEGSYSDPFNPTVIHFFLMFYQQNHGAQFYILQLFSIFPSRITRFKDGPPLLARFSSHLSSPDF